MREILFRGKQVNKDKWIYGVPVKGTDDDESKTLIIESVFKCDEYACRGCDFEPVITSTVCQYTGLTDKNGKKIFEGDIIRYADIYEYEIYLESLEQPENFTECVFDNMWTVDKVVYCIEHSYPAFDLNKHDFEANGLCELKESMQYHYEVIGNIHDNPELLKGGAEE